VNSSDNELIHILLAIVDICRRGYLVSYCSSNLSPGQQDQMKSRSFGSRDAFSLIVARYTLAEEANPFVLFHPISLSSRVY
jgi:hypothetical protein